jgi:hypothetical protein
MIKEAVRSDFPRLRYSGIAQLVWRRPAMSLPAVLAPLARLAGWMLAVLGMLYALGLASMVPEAR